MPIKYNENHIYPFIFCTWVLICLFSRKSHTRFILKTLIPILCSVIIMLLIKLHASVKHSNNTSFADYLFFRKPQQTEKPAEV